MELKCFVVAVAGLILGVASQGVLAKTQIEIDTYGNNPYDLSAPWGYLGTTTFTPADGTFSAWTWFGGSLAFPNAVKISFKATPPTGLTTDLINLTFETASAGTLLEVGDYPNAERAGFNEAGDPGLDYGDAVGGFNTLNGGFTVYDVQRDSLAQITSFAASFYISTDDSPSAPYWVAGRVWFNSDAAIPAVPEPSSWSLLLLGLGIVGVTAKMKY